MVTVREFDQLNPITSLPANTVTSAMPCRTVSYLAGSGETAVIHLDSSVAPLMMTSGLFYLSATVWGNGSVVATSKQSIESLADGAGSTSVNKSHILTANKIYVFGSTVETTTTVNSVFKSSCHGTVTITKP